MAREAALAADNLLPPYADELPLLLPALPPGEVAGALAQFEPAEACQALFGNFRAVPMSSVSLIFEALDDRTRRALLSEMALGYDLPRVAARLLGGDSEAATMGLFGLEPLAGARIAGLMAPDRLAVALSRAGPARASAFVTRILAVASPAEATTVIDAIRSLLPDAGGGHAWIGGELARPVESSWELVAHGVVAHRLARLSPARVAEILTCMPSVLQRRTLAALEARGAAATLVELASGFPESAGLLLGSLAEVLLVRDERARTRSLRRVLHGSRITAVLDCLDPGDQRVAAMLRHTAAEILTPALAGLEPERGRALARAAGCAGAPGWRPCPYPLKRCRGRRHSRRLGPAVRWAQLLETVELSGRTQTLQVDLLELDPFRLRLQACRVDGHSPLLADAVVRLGTRRRGADLPPASAFVDLGLVRLTDAVAHEGAVAAINGNFYVDFGLCLDAQDLGIDLSEEANLHLGDVVGWFISDGRELAPPLFNRAVLAVTASRRAHIRRVAMVDVVLSNGRRLTWQVTNRSVRGATVLWDRLAGTATDRSGDHVDLCVSRSTVVGIQCGGRSRIPLLGFVLAVPSDSAAEVLAGIRVGDQVRIGTNFPPCLGPVEQAMACGPQLVRDGQIDVDFELEGFGEKDTTVVPFSLSREVDGFRAARSFVMVRGGLVIFGVISGLALGWGRSGGASVGMTFGELAQLCVDLGADDALALDGGGSSSLVAGPGSPPRVLNVPTGGSDVPRGVERFIKTYWLVHG